MHHIRGGGFQNPPLETEAVNRKQVAFQIRSRSGRSKEKQALVYLPGLPTDLMICD